MTTDTLATLRFGADYYPEQTPETLWETDLRLMSEAGFNVVRLGEFAWTLMEPEDGRYDFAWLDRALDRLHAHGLQAILGTPTSAPPAWLIRRYPELLSVREDGVRLPYGHRHNFDPTHPLYLDYSRRIVSQMAERYHCHPAVIGWQIGNEFGDRCYSPESRRAFQAWLRCAYGSLEVLNQKWGTAFWSHVYGAWEEIPVPLSSTRAHNPGLVLDFYRFCSDAYVAYQQMQVNLLRERCPTHFITHNFMGFHYDQINYYDLARGLDLVSWDNYPRMQWTMRAEVDPSERALAHAAMRGLKRQNFWVMEQQAGMGGWEVLSVTPRPGELRLWAYQSLAHGADGIVFFRWDTARHGTEQYWHGLLDHDRQPSRRYAEIKQMGAELAGCGAQIKGSTVKAPVAMLLSYDSRFAFQIQANNPRFSYPGHFHQLYRAFHDRQVPVDVVAPGDDLSAYKLVLAPALQVVSAAVAQNLKSYVEAGGVLVVTQRSGVKDESNAVVERRLPGLLAELCGVEIEEYDSLAEGMSNALEFGLPEQAAPGLAPQVGVLCEVLRPTTARVVARYQRDYYAGRPAITHNRFGQGQVIYVGTVGQEDLYAFLADWFMRLANLSPLLPAPTGVEVTERWQGDRRLLFVLNHTATEQIVELGRAYQNLLDGKKLAGETALAPYGVWVLVSD